MVRLFILISILFGFSTSFGQQQTGAAATTQPATIGRSVYDFCEVASNRQAGQSAQDCVNAQTNPFRNEDRIQQRCDQATQRFRDAVREMRKGGCSSLQSCMDTYRDCAECAGEDYDDLDSCGGAGTASTTSVLSSGLGNVFGTQASPQTQRRLSALQSCPVVSRDELEEWERLRDEFKEKMDDAEKEILELAEEKTTAEGKIQDAQKEMQRISQKLQEDLQETMADREEELKEDMQDILSNLTQKKREFQARILQYQNDLQAQYYNFCHQRALQQVGQIREQRNSKAQARQLVVRSINDLSSLTSLRDRLEKAAKSFEEQCKRDSAIKSIKEALDKQFALDTQLLNDSINALKSEFDQKTNLLQDSSQDRKLQRDLRKLQRDAENELDSQSRILREETGKVESLVNQIRALEQRKAEARIRYNEYLQLLNAATGSPGELSRSEFVSAAGTAYDEGGSAFSACKCEEGDQYSGDCSDFRMGNGEYRGRQRSINVLRDTPQPGRPASGNTSAPSSPGHQHSPSGNRTGHGP